MNGWTSENIISTFNYMQNFAYRRSQGPHVPIVDIIVKHVIAYLHGTCDFILYKGLGIQLILCMGTPQVITCRQFPAVVLHAWACPDRKWRSGPPCVDLEREREKFPDPRLTHKSHLFSQRHTDMYVVTTRSVASPAPFLKVWSL